MKESCDEGVATRIGPESCAVGSKPLSTLRHRVIRLRSVRVSSQGITVRVVWLGVVLVPLRSFLSRILLRMGKRPRSALHGYVAEPLALAGACPATPTIIGRSVSSRISFAPVRLARESLPVTRTTSHVTSSAGSCWIGTRA